ncbi:MAG: hypothetical protein ACR2PL_14020 [Dehalococcoidia bacterium]
METPLAILDCLASGVYVVNRQWCYTYGNPAAALVQKTRAELIG